MSRSRSKAVASQEPRLSTNVIVRSPFFPKPVAGLIVEVFDDDEDEVAVYVFPPGREPMSIPAILFFAQEPDADVRSAAWPA